MFTQQPDHSQQAEQQQLLCIRLALLAQAQLLPREPQPKFLAVVAAAAAVAELSLIGLVPPQMGLVPVAPQAPPATSAVVAAADLVVSIILSQWAVAVARMGDRNCTAQERDGRKAGSKRHNQHMESPVRKPRQCAAAAWGRSFPAVPVVHFRPAAKREHR